MVSASEAKVKTQNNINNCETQQLKELSEQISNAIAEGKFSISNDGTLQAATQERLEELGYEIKIGKQYNKAYYSVSWY